jgi:histidinol phosphatase-like enzyme (inositol monophosphatase family)
VLRTTAPDPFHWAPTLDQHLVQLANDLADTAGTVIKPYFRTPLPTEQKHDLSPVTQADRAAEQAMRALIATREPTHAIHGEEFGLENPHSPWRWVLDPIDGTRAFITGRPLFGTLIGLLHEGRPILGIIDQPITGERWLGIAGQKTTFRGPLGGSPGTRMCPTLADAELSATSPELLGDDGLARFQHLATATRRVTWGGDCYAYGLLALGHIDIIAERGLKLWDWAALVPIVQGAGGSMTDWQGQPLREDGPGDALALGDPALLPQAVNRLAAPP